MKVALYSRVSTEEQKWENQETVLKQHAKKEGWDYEIFHEKESTRKTRPVKQELLQRLRNREFNAVCVLKLDRWARSVYELTNDVLELTNKKIWFISLRDNIDLSSPTGQLQFHIMSAFAQFERDLISQRTKDGLNNAKSLGRKLGRPPGSKDKKTRRKSGYYNRWSNNKSS